MVADVLSDVLRTVRLTGAAFFDVVAKAPWAAEQPAPDGFLPKILPGAENLIAYHVVTEGGCFGGIVGGPPVQLAAGEVIVFTHGDPHILSSAPGLRAGPDALKRTDMAIAGPLPFTVSYGEDGPPTAKLVCGFLACDTRPFNPLLDQLPPVMTATDRDGGWLGQFIRFAMTESADKRAGGESVLAKLSELMFIEVVRRYLETLPPEQSGWLAGLRDPPVGRTLALIHGEPARNWTIEELARQVGLSRSVLADRFTRLVGVPPIQYLARWRMQIAAGMLASGVGMATIASEIGYESEAAFSRGFKRVVGSSPSAWRNRGRPADPA